MKQLARSLTLITTAALSTQAFALKTDFKDSHLGMVFGASTYFHWLPHDNAFDPVPGATPTTGTVSGSESTYLVPARLGLFKDSPHGNFSIYGIYQKNFKSAWTVTGTPSGPGTTAFIGKGIGGEATYPVWQNNWVRLNLGANFDYMWQSATLNFNAQTLKLSTHSMLLGLIAEPEIWLGDMYALSLILGYQYGYPQTWSVSTASHFMGNSYAAGKLTNPTTGTGTTAEFGGFQFGASLKLHFQ